MRLAREHAEYQARTRTQGHQNFSKRAQEIRSAGLGMEAAEICAESWKRQENDSMYDLGWEMFKCWKQSPTISGIFILIGRLSWNLYIPDSLS